jgi:hypothetical protein
VPFKTDTQESAPSISQNARKADVSAKREGLNVRSGLKAGLNPQPLPPGEIRIFRFALNVLRTPWGIG